MDYITKNKVQISYMDFRGLCVRWAKMGTLIPSTSLKTNRKIAKTKYRYLGEPYRDDNANQKWFQI